MSNVLVALAQDTLFYFRICDCAFVREKDFVRLNLLVSQHVRQSIDSRYAGATAA